MNGRADIHELAATLTAGLLANPENVSRGEAEKSAEHAIALYTEVLKQLRRLPR